jgi:N-acetylneuraminate synthase
MNIFKRENRQPFVIAEIAQGHDGSLGLAYSMIESAANAGANAVKFQTHYAVEESTAREPWRVKFSQQDKTRFDYWKRMEFSSEQWAGLANFAKEKGIIFLSSPFSVKAVEILDKIDVPFWKIGSGEIDNHVLLDAVIKTGKPLILSTGMSEWKEINEVYNWLTEEKVTFALMHCTSEYPVTPERFGLNVLENFIKNYNCVIGLSSHLPRIGPSIAAYILGANIIEVHVTYDRSMFGPDSTSSLTFLELKNLVNELNLLSKIVNSPMDKDLVSNSLSEVRAKFRKSIVASRNLEVGEKLEETMLSYKKPGDGLPVKLKHNILGRKVVKKILVDDPILFENLE